METATTMNLLFDLDGTLTDPREGIVRSINYALTKFGLPTREPSSLERFIGPPLKDNFRVLLETDNDATLTQGAIWFRERYVVEGYLENRVYEGIPEMLSVCLSLGHRLYIATSKRQDIAEMVLAHFHLAPSFAKVYGCDLDLTKTELLDKIVRNEHISPSNCLMIGDRKHDIEAGRANSMATAGVLWGYGTRDELAAEFPDHLARTPSELLAVVSSLADQR